jgi:cell division protein FtsX
MPTMKGKSVLAVAVCLVCFAIGYLAYLSAALLVDGLKSRVETCLDRDRGCGQNETEPRSR